MASRRQPRKRKGKGFPKPEKVRFENDFPPTTGAVIRNVFVPFDDDLRLLWLLGEYRLLYDRLIESQAPRRVQSMRLVLGRSLQKRAMKANEAAFEVYVKYELVPVSPNVDQAITGFLLRVIYDGKSKKSVRRAKLPAVQKRARRSTRTWKKKLPRNVRKVSKLPRRDAKGRFRTKRPATTKRGNKGVGKKRTTRNRKGSKRNRK